MQENFSHTQWFPYHPCMAYLPAFTININQLQGNIPYMDGLWFFQDCESRSLDAHLSFCDGPTHIDHLDFAYLAISLLGIGAAGAHCLRSLEDKLA